MPRAGFGGDGDLSSFFASLWREDQNNRDRLDAQQEALTKERQAAKDSEMFSKFQNGEISGQDILAYIRSRVAQTKGDASEHAKWTDALRQYEGSVSDQMAEDAYANGGSIQDLISHYRDRQGTLAKGTPAYSDITKRLNQVIDDAQSHDLYLGAQGIQDKIDRGQATLEDLERFLKNQIKAMRPGSPNRDQALQQLNTVQDNINTRNINTSVASLDYKFTAGQITAAEYNTQLLAIAAPFQASDPSFYYGLLTKGQNAIDNEQQTAFDSSAFSDLGYTNPGTSSSSPRPYVPPEQASDERSHNDITYVSQFDGSEFAKVNCVFASGAMLAQAMGVSGLAGSDLRYLSGDTSGGSNYNRLSKALKAVGLNADYNQNIAFNDFLAKIKSGQPATIGGLDSRLPDNLHGSYQGKHSIYVDRYDPVKGFLVYDPATRKPRWWSEEILRAFSWGGGNNPNALFAPVGSVTQNRAEPAHISIFDKPKRADTPPNAGGGNNPGVEDHVRATLAQTGTSPTPRTHPDGTPIPYGQTVPTTQDQAKEDLQVISAMQDRAIDMAALLSQGQTVYTDGTVLNEAVVKDALNEAYGSGAWRGFLANGIHDPSAVQDNFNTTAELGARMLGLGDDRQTQIWNNLLSQTDGIFAHTDANYADPFQSSKVIADTVATLKKFADALDPGQPTADEAVSKPFYDQVRAVIKAAELAANPDADPTDVALAVGALPKNEQGLVSGIEGATQAHKGVADGTLAITVQTDSHGVPSFAAVPARQETLPDGTVINVPNLNVPRALMAPVAILVDGKPTVIFVPSTPQPIPGMTQMVVTNAGAVNAQLKAAGLAQLDPNYTGPLDFARLSGLSTAVVNRLIVNGFGLAEAPVSAPSVVIPSYLSNGVTVPSSTFFQDAATGKWIEGNIPTLRVNPDAYGGVANDADGYPDLAYKPGQGVSVIDATGAPDVMQDFANHGGTNAYDTGIYRDAEGNVAVDPSTAVIPNPSTLYSTSLPSAQSYMQSQQYRDFRAEERAGVGQPVAQGAPPAVAPVPNNAVTAPPVWSPSTSFDLSGVAATASAIGLNLPKTVGTYAKPAYTPPAPKVPEVASDERLPLLSIPSAPRITVAPLPSAPKVVSATTPVTPRIVVPTPTTKTFTPPPPSDLWKHQAGSQ